MLRFVKLPIMIAVAALFFTSNAAFAQQLTAKDGVTNVTLYSKNGGGFDRKEAISADKFNADNNGRLNDSSGEKQGFVATKLGGQTVWVRVSQLKDARITVNCPTSALVSSSSPTVITSGSGAGKGCKQ